MKPSGKTKVVNITLSYPTIEKNDYDYDTSITTKKIHWQKNIYAALVLYLLLAMLFYSLCRIGFYLFNTAYFPDMTFGIFLHLLAGGLVFDLSGVLYSNILFVLLII